MRSGKYFIENLQKCGYQICMANQTQYLLVQYTGNHSKAVVIVDGAYDDCVSDYGADNYRRMAVETLHADPSILIVVFGSRRDCMFYKKNILVFDQFRERIIYSNIAPEFYEEKRLLSKGLKAARLEKKEWEANILSATGKYKKLSVSIMPWIIVAFNIFMMFRFGTRNADIYGINPDTVLLQGQTYRLITYMFMHGGVWHLISNSISLLMIGTIYTKRNGNLDFTATYFIGGIVSGLLSCLIRLPQSTNHAYTVGASGAIFAVLGALTLDAVWRGVERRRLIVGYAITTLILSNLSFKVDRICHIGGFLAGMGIFWVLSSLEDIEMNVSYIRNKRRKEALLEGKS